MAQWDQSTARTSLRALLADRATDKFEFRVPVFPTPDGVSKLFSLGRSNVSSVSVYNNNVAVPAVSGDAIDTVAGTITMGSPPEANATLQASYYYQWFTDAQLDEALLAGCQQLGFEGEVDVTPLAIRPIVLDFAAYSAYMMQAALYAEELVVTAGGYTAHQFRSHPNWRELAKLAWERAKDRLKLYLEDPLASRTPAMETTCYRLSTYQPL